MVNKGKNGHQLFFLKRKEWPSINFFLKNWGKIFFFTAALHCNANQKKINSIFFFNSFKKIILKCFLCRNRNFEIYHSTMRRLCVS